MDDAPPAAVEEPPDTGLEELAGLAGAVVESPGAGVPDAAVEEPVAAGSPWVFFPWHETSPLGLAETKPAPDGQVEHSSDKDAAWTDQRRRSGRW